MIARAAILAFLVLAGPGAAESVTIRNDGGGNVTAYIERRAQLARVDSVRIAGKCLSSCTIFTTLPNACVMPRAVIGFHGTLPRVPFIQMQLDMRLGDFYRGEVRRRYAAEWRHLRGGNEMHVISGRELARLDPEVRLCRKRR